MRTFIVLYYDEFLNKLASVLHTIIKKSLHTKQEKVCLRNTPITNFQRISSIISLGVFCRGKKITFFFNRTGMFFNLTYSFGSS